MIIEFLCVLTVKTMHEFSFNAPQHPRNAITNTTAPTTINNIGADQKLAPVHHNEFSKSNTSFKNMKYESFTNKR